MAKVRVLLEFDAAQDEAFAAFHAAAESEWESVHQAEGLLSPLAGLGVDLEEEVTPVPLFTSQTELAPTTLAAFRAFAQPEPNPDFKSTATVLPAEVDRVRLDELTHRTDVRVWPNSTLSLMTVPDLVRAAAETAEEDAEPFDLARSRPGLDCRPFRPAATIATIRTLLGVRRAWNDGFLGQNTVVGIIDEGVNGSVYPVAGGLSRPGVSQPGSAPITSHGSMCAADVLIAVPQARLYDYPFLGVPRSGGALAMFQAVLEQRRLDGTPHLTNNSYGFVGVPPRQSAPNHEIWDLNHPLHRKVREVIASGAPAFFAAGNCGEQCPSGACHPSGIGPGRSIHASNSLLEVVTVAAVNSRHERIGYSSQGPGMFEQEKPDVACYSHIFGNFGPGRPGGVDDQPFDNGTSAATPVACGVGALLLSAFPNATPAQVRDAIVGSATQIGTAAWDPGYGRGIVNAAAAYRALDRMI